MSLTDWEKNGWLTRHKTSRDEIQNLMKIIQRDLEDSSARTISESEAMELIDTVKELYLKLKKWLYNNYPEYL